MEYPLMIVKVKELFVNLPDFASSLESMQLQRGVGTSTSGAGAFWSKFKSSNKIISTKNLCGNSQFNR